MRYPDTKKHPITDAQFPIIVELTTSMDPNWMRAGSRNVWDDWDEEQNLKELHAEWEAEWEKEARSRTEPLQ